MKKIKDFITEKQNFLIKNKNVLKNYDHYDYTPTKKEELQNIILELLKQGETDLNCINTSKITDMSNLFETIDYEINIRDINISEWDVSNVKNMNGMFKNCFNFNADLSNWDVSSVHNMMNMFRNCHEFNSDLSKWDVSNVKDMELMFSGCFNFNSDLSKWDVSNVTDMYAMFNYCLIFDYDLSSWNILSITTIRKMFNECTTLEKNNKLPKWYTN